MLNKIVKTALLAAMGAAFLIAGGCGQKADQNTRKVGPTGPTTPSGYYFTLEVHPAVVQIGGTVTLVVSVTNAAGTPIDGTVTPVTVHYSGTMTSGSDAAIDATGIAGLYLTITGTGGTTAYANANVEDKSLTVPIQILP